MYEVRGRRMASFASLKVHRLVDWKPQGRFEAQRGMPGQHLLTINEATHLRSLVRPDHDARYPVHDAFLRLIINPTEPISHEHVL